MPLLLVLCLLGLVLLLGGCRDGDDNGEGAAQPQQAVRTDTRTQAAQPGSPEASPAGEPSGQASAPAAARDAAPAAPAQEKVRVYALSEPLPPASPQEIEEAQQVVDYANAADRALESSCGRYPELVMAGVASYREAYTAPSAGNAPAPTCLRKALTPGQGILPDVAARIGELAETMDSRRESLRKAYDRLRDYVADTSIRDDGRLGEQLCREMDTAFVAYAAAMEEYRALVDERAGSAQDVLLRGHPLRDHVLLVNGIVALFRAQADRLALAEPDPASLEEPLLRLARDIETAERLPFPIAGLPEMHYRHFLKSSWELLGLLRRGQLESFHASLRRLINEQWGRCRLEYNAFVDALAS